ncbi:MMPL family transporter [Streptomyces iconiensis]|uniref:MMPL family transporter n=1 Tax=Streptomyces iconiensis TaxID=1384038 RepID=A0ABT7A7F1_9ACTN|nr:MMPL family transporter [Streptomyces iconiensis]MDJ1136944.1 MMPL family transporter [Streptomyces iconiensis]
MFERIAELAIRRSRLVLVVAAVVVALMGAVGAGAFGKLVDGGYSDPGSESSKAETAIDDKFGGETNLVLLVSAGEGRADTPGAERAGRALTADLKKEKHLENVMSYWDTGNPGLRSKDGGEAMVAAHVKGGDSASRDNAKEILDKYTGKREGGLDIRATGSTVVGQELGTQSGVDLVVAEAIAIPLTLLLLLFVFGSAVAALLPLAIAVIAIAGSLAELSLLGGVTSISITATNLTTALGLGLAIDYALLMVSRFREQLDAGAEVPDAVRHTVATAGRTVAFSAATVAIALAALAVFPMYFLRSFAYAGVGVVVIASVGTLFVMPALLNALGHRVNSGRMPWAKRKRAAASAARKPLWGRLAGTVMRRPALTALPVLAVLLVAASPLLGINFGTADERVLPEDAESRQVSELLRTNFDGDDNSAIHVVFSQSVGTSPLDAYAKGLSGLKGVVRVESSTGTYVEGTSKPAGPAGAALARPDAQRVNVVSSLTPKSEEAESLVKAVRAAEPPAGTAPLVGGTDADLVDSKDSISSNLPLAATLVALTTFILLFLFTGSVVHPLRALVLNGISLSAALGVVTWMFQDGHLAGVFGFTPQPMDTSMTVLMFCIAFGLSMDYEVFVTSRIKELHDQGESTGRAVVNGLGHTGGIITAAAAVLSVSFFAFGTAKISFMMMFGLGTGLAILLDAVAVRGILLPAAMRLLGRSAWYAPPFLRKFHARFGLSEGGPAPAPSPSAEPAAGTSQEKDSAGV